MLPSHPDGREVMRASTDAGEDGPVEIDAEEPEGLAEGVPEQAAPAIDRANSTQTRREGPLSTHGDRTRAVKRSAAVCVERSDAGASLRHRGQVLRE